MSPVHYHLLISLNELLCIWYIYIYIYIYKRCICKHKVFYFLCGSNVVEQLWKIWFENFDAYCRILFLFYIVHGNARNGDNIIYMIRVIIIHLHAKFIIWPCSQERVVSYGGENYKWLVWKLHCKTSNVVKLLMQLKVK